MRKLTSLLLATTLLAAPLTGCGETGGSEMSSGSSGSSGSRLNTVQARGKLICGVEGNIPGFSFVDQSGSYSGIDVDVCKAVAAALFNDPNAVVKTVGPASARNSKSSVRTVKQVLPRPMGGMAEPVPINVTSIMVWILHYRTTS